jgi:hypothetical protein
MQDGMAAVIEKVKKPMAATVASMTKRGQAAEEHLNYTHMGGVELHHPIPKTVPWVDLNAIKTSLGRWKSFTVENPMGEIPPGPLLKPGPPAPVAKPKEPVTSVHAFHGHRSQAYGVEVMGPLFVNDMGKGPNTKPFQGASRSEPNMEYVEEPTMIYMTLLTSVPFAFSFWFLTRFV